MKVKNPPLRYFGGKWSLAPWQIEHFPQHRSYVEVFGGSAAMLFRKPKSNIEVYNDTYGDIVNFMRVLRDQGPELQALLKLTPYSRRDFHHAQTSLHEGTPLERARKFYLFANSGIQGAGARYITGFRTSISQNTAPQKTYCRNVDKLLHAADRLREVVIEDWDFRKILTLYGKSEDAFLYMDPPYTKDSRAGQRYKNEFSSADHLDMLTMAASCKAKLMICGYPNDLYDAHLSAWWQSSSRAFTTGMKAGGKVERIEKIWCNYQPKLTLL